MRLFSISLSTEIYFRWRSPGFVSPSEGYLIPGPGLREHRFSPQQVLVSSILLFLLIALSGCGVKIATIVSGSGAVTNPDALQLSANANELFVSQSTILTLQNKGVPTNTISLSVQCDENDCGRLVGYRYTAPTHLNASQTITVTASSSVPGVTASAVAITVLPAPEIFYATPSTVPSGTGTDVTFHGAGFTKASILEMRSEMNGSSGILNSQTVLDQNTIVAHITIPPLANGLLHFTLETDDVKASNSVDVIATTATEGPPQSLPIFDVASYGASGSPAVYVCSGEAGQRIMTCTGDTDFKPGQGIRIVGGGAGSKAPVVANPPVVTEEGQNSSGSHTYCYLVSAVDALGGISKPSPPSCLNHEPDLSYTGSYNIVSGTYDYPLVVYLWYVSQDGGPYRLFTVNGSMDVGQRPGNQGGWPDSIPSSDPDVSKNDDLFARVVATAENHITLSAPLETSILNASVDHDDTDAIQSAIDHAAAAKGGVIDLGAGTFNIRRPTFINDYSFESDSPFYGYTLDEASSPSWGRWYYLYLQNGSVGNIYFEGSGASTILQTPPDNGGNGIVFGFGNFIRPATAPYVALGIEDVEKGANSISLTSPADAQSLHSGDDIWLYSGNFQPGVCVNIGDTAGGQCHYSELNTITAIDGNQVSLAYPASKRYYDDGINSFGVVKMPITPHNIGIENLTIKTFDRIYYAGLVYGLLINHVTVDGVIRGGGFGGGYKRDVLIENSSWSVGGWDASWAGTDEYDQFTNLVFLNNKLVGYAAAGAEGPSLMGRLYMTEGTSEVTVNHNIFDHVSVYFQETTDDVIEDNQFIDAYPSAASSYNPVAHQEMWSNLQDASYTSFGSQGGIVIDGNTLSIDSSFEPPYLILVGHFASSTIDHNTITYDGTRSLAAIISGGGLVTNNRVTIGAETASSIGIAVVPDEGPDSPQTAFTLKGNRVSAPALASGIDIVNPGFVVAAPICIEDNSLSSSKGTMIDSIIPFSTNCN